jgi:hypothetical protein
MGSPEVVTIADPFDKFRGATAHVIARDGTMPEYVPKSFTQLVADFRYAFVGGTAMGTGITAVFDQGNRRIDRTKEVVFSRIDWSIKPGAQRDVAPFPGSLLLRT